MIGLIIPVLIEDDFVLDLLQITETLSDDVNDPYHYPVIRELGLEPHLNTSFKQYVLFIDEHGLASGRDYWGPLGDLVDSMLKSD